MKISEKSAKIIAMAAIVCVIVCVSIIGGLLFLKAVEPPIEKFYTKAEYDRIIDYYPKGVLSEYNSQYSVISNKPLMITKEKVDEYTYYDDIGLKISGEFYIKPLLGTRYYYTYECTFLWDKELKIFYYMGTTIAEKE